VVIQTPGDWRSTVSSLQIIRYNQEGAVAMVSTVRIADLSTGRLRTTFLAIALMGRWATTQELGAHRRFKLNR